MSGARALLRLGWRDLAHHRLRSTLVIVLIAVGSVILTVPLIVVVQVLTPGANMAVTGTDLPVDVDQHIDPGTLVALFASASLALVLGALLIAPAFLISARGRVRELGMIAAAGAGPRGLAVVVLAPALLAGLLGAALGAGAAAVFFAAVTRPSGPADVTGILMGSLLATVLGTAAAGMSAAWPAILAARSTPVAASRELPPGAERPGTEAGLRPGARTHVLTVGGGVLVGAGGVALILSGARPRGECGTAGCEIISDFVTRDAGSLVAGVLLVGVGVVAVLAGGLGLLARARLRSVVGSYVVRDAARHRLRIVPAIAASAMLLAGAGAAAIYQTTVVAKDLASHVQVAPLGAAVVGFEGAGTTAEDVATLVERLEQDSAIALAVPVRIAAPADPQLDGSLAVAQRAFPHRHSALTTGGTLLGEESLVNALGLGETALSAVRADKALVADAELVSGDGHVVLAPSGYAERGVVVEAEVVPTLGRYADVMIPEWAALELGRRVQARGVVVIGHQALTSADEARLAGAAPGAWAMVERGSPVQQDLGAMTASLAGGGLAVLVVMWVLAVLTATETRGELGVLEALGIAPRTRRRMALLQSALVVVPSAVLGVPAAVGLALMFLAVQPQHATLAIQVPPLAVVGLVVGVPVVVLLGSWLGAPAAPRQPRRA